MAKARHAKHSYAKLKKAVENLSEIAALDEWRMRATETSRWLVKPFDSRPEDASEIRFHPTGLIIGAGDFNAPREILEQFNVIGIVGNDEIAWICKRAGQDGIWEFDGTEFKYMSSDPAQFQSLSHYLLFTHLLNDLLNEDGKDPSRS